MVVIQVMKESVHMPIRASMRRVARVKAPLGPLLSACWNCIACSLFRHSLAISISCLAERESVIMPNTPLRILPIAAEPPPVKNNASNSNITI